ncbi:MAG: hypothetical protein AAF483_12635 [Planctomycetota bacterium]
MTDGKMAAAIRRASRNGTAFFTANQLYAAYASRAGGRPKWAGPVLGFAALISLGTIASFGQGEILSGISWLLFSLPFFWLGIFYRSKPVRPAMFASWIDLWLRSGKTIDGLIQQPSLHQPPPQWSEQDIYDYGVERILIVQHDLLVDLFVRNGLHAEQRALVISESGYPSYLMAVTKRLLEERPDLPVFAFHDADAQGQAMMQRLFSMDLPLKGRPITDLGMRPEQFKKSKRTRSYDPYSTDRDLPADAMPVPMLAAGLGACFAAGAAQELLGNDGNAPGGDEAALTVGFGAGDYSIGGEDFG